MSRPYSHRKSQNQRRELDGKLCQFCSSDKAVAAHHIFGYSKGGPSAVEGMVTACRRCHLNIIHADSEVEIFKKENDITTSGKGGKWPYNKSKHADLVKLSPFLFRKIRQLHQTGV